MPRIDHHAPLQCLVAVRGHPFDRNAFDAMFQAMDGISATMVDQPAAALLMNPEGMSQFDALVLYDMPGLDFDCANAPPAYRDPDPALKEGFAALLEQGTGIVALHHALAAWPTWPEYHEWIGGQFFYLPGSFGGKDWPDSGYRHDVHYEAEVMVDHPVTKGLPARFELTDELYLCPDPPPDATPLLRSSAEFGPKKFWSAELAVCGQPGSNHGWTHPPSDGVIAWARQEKASRIVYLQPGDGLSAFENSDFRKLVENAVRWVSAGGKPRHQVGESW